MRCAPVYGKRKELLIKSRKENAGRIGVEVEDCGIGFNPEIGDKIFGSVFYDEKPGYRHGTVDQPVDRGVYAGRLWACQRRSGGAIFSLRCRSIRKTRCLGPTQ